MVTTLGWINVALIVFMFGLFTLRRIQKHIIKKPNALIKKMTGMSAFFHPYLGLVIITAGIIHGQAAITMFSINAGHILLLSVVAMFAIRIWGGITKNKKWVKIHRSFSPVVVLTLLIHIFTQL